VTGGPIEWAIPGVVATLPQVETWRVHHYFTRHRSSWSAKITRGRPARNAPSRTVAEIAMHDRNEIYDPTALRYVPEVRAMLARLGAA
jgi:hypothetical protein